MDKQNKGSLGSREADEASTDTNRAKEGTSVNPGAQGQLIVAQSLMKCMLLATKYG